MEDDFDDLYEILSDFETMKHYPKPFDKEMVVHWIEWNIENYNVFGFGLWAVILKENGKLIGDCGITMQNIDGKIKPEIGYHINKKYQNNGFATEAARKCKDYIFENTPFNTLYSYMKHTNKSSAAVAIKNGMKFVYEFDDVSRVYAITREQWRKENKNLI